MKIAKVFQNVNINPKGIKTGDCVIRAIANAEGRSWYEVYDDLSKLAREICTSPCNRDCYDKYLSKYPTVPAMFTNDYGVRKRKRPEVFRELGHGHGTYVVRLAGHLTCVRDGVTEDIWDCSSKSAYKIWRIK